MLRLFIAAAVLGLSAAAPSDTPDNAGAAAAAFARLRALEGEWEGPYEWTGARTGSGTINAAYSRTGNDSAVVETLSTGGVPMMTSVYHLDGADLRMTHYCAAQNQPRLKASRIDLGKGVVEFTFLDVTNLRSPDAGHVHGLEIRFLDADHVALTFQFQTAGQRSDEHISLKRAAGKPLEKGR